MLMKKLGEFVLVHFIFYLIGCFIAWDFNLFNWWLFTSSVGRIFFLIFEIIGISNFLMED